MISDKMIRNTYGTRIGQSDVTHLTGEEVMNTFRLREAGGRNV